MQACLLGEEDVQGILVMCTYLTRLLSKLSSNRTLFSYVPEVQHHFCTYCLSVCHLLHVARSLTALGCPSDLPYICHRQVSYTICAHERVAIQRHKD